MSSAPRYERSCFIGDIHVPYHDRDAILTALAFLEEFRPHVVFLMGDVLDFYALSKFDRNPERLLTLQQEIDAAHVVLSEIRRAAKQADIFYLRGNHEQRLTKYLWTKAIELESLRAIRLEVLLELARLNIRYVEQGRMTFHGFIVKHGTIVRKKAGYTAYAELEREGTSGISGHTHRMAQVFKRNTGGEYTWVESGCLCRLDPEYADGETMDWCQGLVYSHFKRGDERFIVHPLPIVGHKIVFEGQEITA